MAIYDDQAYWVTRRALEWASWKGAVTRKNPTIEVRQVYFAVQEAGWNFTENQIKARLRELETQGRAAHRVNTSRWWWRAAFSWVEEERERARLEDIKLAGQCQGLLKALPVSPELATQLSARGGKVWMNHVPGDAFLTLLLLAKRGHVALMHVAAGLLEERQDELDDVIDDDGDEEGAA